MIKYPKDSNSASQPWAQWDLTESNFHTMVWEAVRDRSSSPQNNDEQHRTEYITAP